MIKFVIFNKSRQYGIRQNGIGNLGFGNLVLIQMDVAILIAFRYQLSRDV